MIRIHEPQQPLESPHHLNDLIACRCIIIFRCIASSFWYLG